MSTMTRQRIRQDLDLVERFSESYQQRFAELIRQLNRDPTPQIGRQCLRLCVETVNMMLGTQHVLAWALKTLTEEAGSCSKAA